jgi:hypothetical protein
MKSSGHPRGGAGDTLPVRLAPGETADARQTARRHLIPHAAICHGLITKLMRNHDTGVTRASEDSGASRTGTPDVFRQRGRCALRWDRPQLRSPFLQPASDRHTGWVSGGGTPGPIAAIAAAGLRVYGAWAGQSPCRALVSRCRGRPQPWALSATTIAIGHWLFRRLFQPVRQPEPCGR